MSGAEALEGYRRLARKQHVPPRALRHLERLPPFLCAALVSQGKPGGQRTLAGLFSGCEEGKLDWLSLGPLKLGGAGRGIPHRRAGQTARLLWAYR